MGLMVERMKRVVPAHRLVVLDPTAPTPPQLNFFKLNLSPTTCRSSSNTLLECVGEGDAGHGDQVERRAPWRRGRAGRRRRESLRFGR